MIETPKDLNEIALKKWSELIKVYRVNNQTKDIILAICQCYSRFIEAEQHMNDKGMLYKNLSGKIEPSPMITISNQMQSQIKSHFLYLEKYKKTDDVFNML
jgi:phage terminase small subunit